MLDTETGELTERRLEHANAGLARRRSHSQQILKWVAIRHSFGRIGF